MTYEQAIALIQQRYGTTSPYSIGVTNPDLQTFLAANNVPSTIRTQIGYAYYTAQRTQTGIDSVLTSRGYLTPTTTTTTPTTATSSTAAGTISPLPTVTSPTTTTTTTSDVPVVSVPSIFTQPAPAPAPEPVTTIAVPTFTAPSLVNTPTTTSPAVTSTTIPTVYRTDREVIQDGKRYYVMSDGSLRLAADQTGITAPATATATTTDEQDRIRAMMGLPPLTTTTTTSPIQVPTTSTTSTGVPTIPVITAPTLPEVQTESPITVPTVSNPLPQPTVSTSVPVISAPALPVTTTSPTAAQMGGSLEDQINYQSAIRRLTAQLGLSRESAKQQAGEVRAQYETQLRKAARDRYAAQVKAIASLGARGISGAPGLSVAARRAGGAEADYRRLGLIGERERQLSALNRTLTQQLADYEEELRRNQEQLTRATTLANQLTGANQ